MEAIEKNNTSNTHQEKAKKLRKLRRWQIVVSLLGVAIVVWGIIEVACLFLSYNRTETSNDAQIVTSATGAKFTCTPSSLHCLAISHPYS